MKKTNDQKIIERAVSIINAYIHWAEEDNIADNDLHRLKIMYEKLSSERKRTPAEQKEIIALCLKTLEDDAIKLNDEIFENNIVIAKLNNKNLANSNTLRAVSRIKSEIAQLYKDRDITDKNRRSSTIG